MSYRQIRAIPSPAEIISEVPLTKELAGIKAERDRQLLEIVHGLGGRFLVIVGPCSANDEDAVCDYVYRLAKVQDRVQDKLFIVPRIYTNKPRTTGEGYKGMLHQPTPGREPNIKDGILSIRRMHVRAIRESGMTAADEMLYPDNLVYVEDMLSYIAIGARSVENQQHRLVTSAITVPVGMKNPTSGDISVMLNSIQAAQSSHNFYYQGYEVESSGNPTAHAILRGSVNKHGESIPNYHYEDLSFVAEKYLERELENPMIVVDVSHANSRKLYYEQPRIAKEILHSRKYSGTLSKMVKGLMIESYLVPGGQKETSQVYGQSITDPCLGWEETEQLLLHMADAL